MAVTRSAALPPVGALLLHDLPPPATPSRPPQLAREERWDLEQRCDTMLCAAIAAFGTFDGVMDAARWRQLQRREELTVYREIDAEPPRPAVRLVGAGFLHGAIDSVTAALYCDADPELVHLETILSGAVVLDGAVLQVTERRGHATPFRFAGVKWYAIQSGGEARDLLTYERMGVTLDADNTEVAYHVVHGMTEHPEWPSPAHLRAPSPTSSSSSSTTPPAATHRPLPRVRRMDPFTICYLYRKVTEGLVQCYVVAEYSSQLRSRAQRYIETAITDRILMITNVLAASEAKRLTAMLNDCQDTPVQMSKSCLRCRARRSALDALRVCGICRKCVCKNCRVIKVICRLNRHTRLPETEAFCHKCLERGGISATPCDGLMARQRKEAPPPRATAAGPGGSGGQGEGFQGYEDMAQWAGASPPGGDNQARESYRADHHRESRHHRIEEPVSDDDLHRPRNTHKEQAQRYRRHVSTPLPQHDYNYDALLTRSRASHRDHPSARAPRHRDVGDPFERSMRESHSNQRASRFFHTVIMPSNQQEQPLPPPPYEHHRHGGFPPPQANSEDLYLSNSTRGSETERQYRLYLERRRTLDLDTQRSKRIDLSASASSSTTDSSPHTSPFSKSVVLPKPPRPSMFIRASSALANSSRGPEEAPESKREESMFGSYRLRASRTSTSSRGFVERPVPKADLRQDLYSGR